MKRKNFIITEALRPLWQRIIAASLYTIILVFNAYIFLNFDHNFSLKIVNGFVGIFAISISLLAVAIKLSVIKTLYFNFEEKKFKKEMSVGPVRIGKWHHLPEIEYVCAFRQTVISDLDGDGFGEHKIRYDVNIWYGDQKHITVYSNYNKETVIEMGLHLARKFDTEYLDATDPFDKKWVEIKT